MCRPTPDLLQHALTRPQAEVWSGIQNALKEIWAPAYPASPIAAEIKRREQLVARWDLVLSHSAWELWHALASSLPSTAARLVETWSGRTSGRAILILDGLSLREWPILASEANRHGLTVFSGPPYPVALPPETNRFARSLGFPSRGALDNRGGKSTCFPGAVTWSCNLPWLDAAKALSPVPDIFFWHHWPDELLHHHDGSDGGLDRVVPLLTAQLSSPDFWHFVKALAQGRHLVITSDHGYANSGAFPNAEPDQKDDLKAAFAAQRHRTGDVAMKEWLPPLALTVNQGEGPFTAVLGRRKWQVPGGFPTLSHGGLTLMEVFVPWIEVSPMF